MRARPGDSPQKSGRRFEQFFAKLLGVEPQKGSGNTWLAKLDVADGKLTCSLKWTTDDGFRINKTLLREADNAIYENGDNSIPCIATAIDSGSEVLVTLRMQDFLRLMESDAARYITPSKGEQKRRRAGIPGLLREDD